MILCLLGNGQGHFSIEESSGVIRVNGTLDREDTRRYTLVSFTTFRLK